MVVLGEIVDVLERTPRVLDGLLAGLDPAWLERDDGPGTWSASAIVGHLLHGEHTDWMPRVGLILSHGTARPFEPFDREAMLGWAVESIDVRLERFTTARRASLAGLSTLDLRSVDLDRRGVHPAIGEVTLGQLLATWVAHDLTHLAQIGEVLARRYRDAVGPWRAHLPALDGVAPAE
jgi:hypothetical protein